MTAHHAMHLLGILSLTGMFVTSAFIFADAAQQWPRIWSTLCGRHLREDAA